MCWPSDATSGPDRCACIFPETTASEGCWSDFSGGLTGCIDLMMRCSFRMDSEAKRQEKVEAGQDTPAPHHQKLSTEVRIRVHETAKISAKQATDLLKDKLRKAGAQEEEIAACSSNLQLRNLLENVNDKVSGCRCLFCHRAGPSSGTNPHDGQRQQQQHQPPDACGRDLGGK